MEENVNNQLDICGSILDIFSMNKQDIRTISPLTLAYIGDCIYDLVIRTIVVERGNAPVNKLHKRVSDMVKASAQMNMYKLIEDELTDKEKAEFKRGRNAKSYTSAKNASKSDYRSATGFEAMLGYLYLNGESARVVELIKLGIERQER